MTNQEIYNTLKNQGFGVTKWRTGVEVYLNRKLYKQEVEIALPEIPEEVIVQSGNKVIVCGWDG